METHFGKGIAAGFVATVVLSVLMILKALMGMMPDMNAIKMLAGMAHGYLGWPAAPWLGWLLHFAIGTIAWGLLFALLFGSLPGRPVVRGLLFGTGAWLLMMIIVMPMAGAGFFGWHLGVGAAVATLVLHWVFGAVLGAVYGRLICAGACEAPAQT